MERPKEIDEIIDWFGMSVEKYKLYDYIVSLENRIALYEAQKDYIESNYTGSTL